MEILNEHNRSAVIGTLERKEADLAVLVLASQGILGRVVPRGMGFEVEVADVERLRAEGVLALFYIENKPAREAVKGMGPSGIPNRHTSVIIAFVLAALHWAALRSGLHETLIHRFGSSALYVLQGEVYRCFTALLLHADLQHLLGNMAGIIVFGIPVCTRTGSFWGILLMVGTGVAGNVMTAFLHRNAHLSIGASTAVLGAAGILVAFQIIRQAPSPRLRSHFLIPLGAGAALLGMLSGGERTDVAAHLFGFLWGIVLGSLFAALDRRSGFLPERAGKVATVATAGMAIVWVLMKNG